MKKSIVVKIPKIKQIELTDPQMKVYNAISNSDRLLSLSEVSHETGIGSGGHLSTILKLLLHKKLIITDSCPCGNSKLYGRKK